MLSASSGRDLLRLQQLPQRHPVHVLHQQVVKPVRLAEIMHGHDVRVVQPRQRLGLAREPLGELRVRSLLRREDLQRHQPVQLRLARLIDHPHPAAAEAFEDFQLREVLGDLLRFGRRRRDNSGSVRAGFARRFSVGSRAELEHALGAEPLEGARGHRLSAVWTGGAHIMLFTWY